MAVVIVITARRNGFRRCGVAHSDQPTTWQPDDFTPAQWAALLKEPQLVITCGEVDLYLEREQHHAFTSAAALPEAPNTLQITEPQASETIVTPVVAPVVNVVDTTLSGDQPAETAPGTPGVNSAVGGLLIDGLEAPAVADGGDDPSCDDQQDADKPPVTPLKAKAGKAKAGKE